MYGSPDTQSLTVTASSTTPAQLELQGSAAGFDLFGDLAAAQQGDTVSVAKVGFRRLPHMSPTLEIDVAAHGDGSVGWEAEVGRRVCRGVREGEEQRLPPTGQPRRRGLADGPAGQEV